MKEKFITFIICIVVILITILPFPQYWSKMKNIGEHANATNIDIHDELRKMGKYVSTPTTKNTKLFGIIDRIGAMVLPDRYFNFQSNMSNIGLYNQMYILDAIRGENLEEKTALYDKTRRSMKPNQIGCALSHLKLIQDFVDDSTVNYIFIMEDDLKIITMNEMRLFEFGFKELIAKIPNFDIFYLSYTIEDRSVPNIQEVEKIQKETGLQYIWKMNGCLCASAYVISKKGAKKILERALPVTEHIDKVYEKGIRDGFFLAYGMISRIFDQDKKNIKSTLGDSGNYFQFLRSAFVVPMPKLLETTSNFFPGNN